MLYDHRVRLLLAVILFVLAAGGIADALGWI